MILCCCFFVVACTTFSQTTTTTDHLLWYKGKKIKNNVLLTERGDTVFYQPSKGTIRVATKRGSKNAFDEMQAELNKTPQRIQQTLSKIAAAVPKSLSPYFSAPVKQAFNSIQEEYKDVLSNTIQLPDWNLVEKEMIQVTGHGPSMGYKEYIDIEKLLAEFIEKVKKYGEKIKAEKLTEVPVPPRRDIGYCYTCDTIKSSDRIEYDLFIEKLWGEDDDMHRLIMGAYRQAQLLGDVELDTRLRAAIEPVEKLIISRKMQRLRMLIDKYLDDPYYNYTVIQLVMGMERQRQLMGIAEQEEDFLFPTLMRTFDVYESFYIKAKEEYNYQIMLDIRSMLSIERTIQLMGLKRKISFLDLYLSFNHFKMSINVSEKMGTGEVYIISQIRGDNYFAAVPDTNCKLKWILLGPDKDDMKFNLESVDYVAPIPPRYMGTKDWYSDKPIMKLDFCDDADTVEAAQFYPVGMKEKWNYPAPLGIQYYPVISSTITACFINKERVYQKEAQWNNSENVEALKAQMMAEYEKFKKNSKGLLGKDPANMNQEEMMKMAKAMTATDKISDLIQAPSVINFFIKTTAANKNKTVFKEMLNGKELFPDNAAIQYAYFHIQLEHDSNSPYKLDLMYMRGALSGKQ